MPEMIPTRDGFGKAIVELGKQNKNIVVVSGDLEDATRAEYFKKEIPERFFNLGIAEQDVVGTAVGLSFHGFIPFATSFAVFLTNRAYDMIRIDVCYNNCNVKMVCSHTGVTVGEDGATAQCLEDFAIMRVLPNLVVVCPVDSLEAKKATATITEFKGPVYMRTSRAPFPVITQDSDPFILGKANILREGKDVAIIACGIMVSEAMKAAEILKEKKIDCRIVNMHTIKPIDEKVIIESAKATGAIVTAEEHQINGGLGSAVAEVLGRNFPVPIEMIAVNDSFGETGTPMELLKKFHLTDMDIVNAVEKIVKRKKGGS